MMVEYGSFTPGTRSIARKLAVCTLTFLAILALSDGSLAADEDSQTIAAVARLIEAGKLEAAESRLWDVLAHHPEDAEALNLLGTVRLQQKRFAEAETLLLRAISLAPDLLAPHVNLARVFHAENERDKEISALLDAQRLAPSNPQVNCDLAAAYVKQNDFHHALESLERIPRARRPDSALPLLAASYLGLGRIPEAQALAAEVDARAAKAPRLRIDFAEVLLDFDLVNDALRLLEIAQKEQPPSAELFFALGRAREHKGEFALAEKDFRRAVDLNPSSADALEALSRTLAREGQWEKSVDLLNRADKMAPGSAEILRKLAVADLRSGHPASAVEAAQQLVKLRPGEPEALYLLGVAQLQSEQTEAARISLENYAKLKPQDALAFLALGMLNASLRKFQDAQANFEQAIKLDPAQAEPYYELALIFREQGDNHNAIAQLEKVVGIDPQRAPAQALLGTLYLQQQDYARAQEHLTRAADLAPASPDTHYQLGLLYARLNQPDRALREMTEFRKLREKEHPSAVPPGSGTVKSSPPYPPS
jgi:tetratricopeptide (TPR) repeat protein